MKRIRASIFVVLFLLFSPSRAKADLFGGDVAVLSQILVQAIMQLSKLRDIMGNAQANLDLVRQINQGINDSLSILKTIDPNLDPGIYKNWTTVQNAIRQLEDIYGKVPDSKDAQIQRDTDQNVAEAVSFNNSFYKYSQNYDVVAERIKDYSHQVSPGGAAKLSAQALGIIIQILNQNLRAQATQLKLQAQEMAVNNRREKEETRHYLETNNWLKTALKKEKTAFALPRF